MSGKWMRWVLRHDSGKWYGKQSLVPVKTFSLAATYPTKEAAEKVANVLIGYTPELVNVREESPRPLSSAAVALDSKSSSRLSSRGRRRSS